MVLKEKNWLEGSKKQELGLEGLKTRDHDDDPNPQSRSPNCDHFI